MKLTRSLERSERLEIMSRMRQLGSLSKGSPLSNAKLSSQCSTTYVDERRTVMVESTCPSCGKTRKIQARAEHDRLNRNCNSCAAKQRNSN